MSEEANNPADPPETQPPTGSGTTTESDDSTEALAADVPETQPPKS
jgi:hypothetical protein